MVEQQRAPEFLFENVGSHGDVIPLIGIAAELVRRGHRCQLLANEHFRAEAQQGELAFSRTLMSARMAKIRATALCRISI
jgi:hypothetical protein